MPPSLRLAHELAKRGKLAAKTVLKLSIWIRPNQLLFGTVLEASWSLSAGDAMPRRSDLGDGLSRVSRVHAKERPELQAEYLKQKKSR